MHLDRDVLPVDLDGDALRYDDRHLADAALLRRELLPRDALERPPSLRRGAAVQRQTLAPQGALHGPSRPVAANRNLDWPLLNEYSRLEVEPHLRSIIDPSELLQQQQGFATRARPDSVQIAICPSIVIVSSIQHCELTAEALHQLKFGEPPCAPFLQRCSCIDTCIRALPPRTPQKPLSDRSIALEALRTREHGMRWTS